MKAHFPAFGLSRRQFVSAAGLSAMATILAAPGFANRAIAQPTGFRELRPLPQNSLPSRIDLRNALRLNIPLEPGPSAASQPKAADGKKISNSKVAQQQAVVSWTAMDQSSASLGSPLFSAKRDRPISLAFVNSGSDAHVIHVHGHAFRLLDSLDDGWKPFWLDTLLVPPQQTARIAFLPDSPGRWAIARNTLSDRTGESRNRESLTWFEVV